MSKPTSAAISEKTARRVMVLGASGTIGRAVVGALIQRGFAVVCPVRDGAKTGKIEEATIKVVDFADPLALGRDGFADENVEVVISCIASRTGVPADAWAVDYRAQLNALEATQAAGVRHFILLSAICVQKPRLAFQFAKLKFEAALISSGLRFTIVRPTAFFKSLSGQVERVKAGRAFLIFGDGRLTACKPISDRDLADYLVDCIADPGRWNAILPIGGPGAAITPREQGEALFAMTGRRPKFRRVPLAAIKGIAKALSIIGKVIPAAATKAELARIGHYYATESMLLINNDTGQYDPVITPSTGRHHLFDHYRAMLQGSLSNEPGDHSVF